MIRKALVVISALAIALSGRALHVINGPVAHSPYVFAEDFEYANNTAATTAGWSVGSGNTFGYTTSPAPIAGSYSTAYLGTITSPAFTLTGSEMWVCFRWTPTALTNEASFCQWSGVDVKVRTSGAIRIFSNATNTNSAGTVTAGTVYYVKIRFVPGASGTARVEVTVSVNSNFSSPVATVTKTDGTAASLPTTLSFTGATASTQLIDTLRVMNADPGNFPP